MLKKISVRDVRMGMFVAELCGSWLDHPFWKKAFLLERERDLQALRASAIEEIWIDTDKGLDVEVGQPAATAAEKTPPPVMEAAKKTEQRIPLHEEIQRAQKTHAKARRTVAAVFREARAGGVLHVAEAAELADEIVNSVSRNSGALLGMSRLKGRDDHAYLHCVGVGALMVALGRQMGMEGGELRSLALAGLLHDVGKTKIPDEILDKPGKLDAAEFEVVKTHCKRGWEMLKAEPGVDDIVLDVCLHHHERVDGTGYPDKTFGESLSVYARMAAVCDVYEALTSDCSYRRAYSPADAIRKMTAVQDVHFDKIVFHAFVKTVGIYPAGTLVKLTSGRLAVVTDQSTKSLTTPIVKVFFSTKTNEPVPPVIVDLSKVPDPIASVEIPARWKLDMKAMVGI